MLLFAEPQYLLLKEAGAIVSIVRRSSDARRIDVIIRIKGVTYRSNKKKHGLQTAVRARRVNITDALGRVNRALNAGVCHPDEREILEIASEREWCRGRDRCPKFAGCERLAKEFLNVLDHLLSSSRSLRISDSGFTGGRLRLRSATC